MGEDQASRRLDVDEHGISQGGNLWAGPSTESFPSIDSSRKGDYLLMCKFSVCANSFSFTVVRLSIFTEKLMQESLTERWMEAEYSSSLIVSRI